MEDRDKIRQLVYDKVEHGMWVRLNKDYVDLGIYRCNHLSITEYWAGDIFQRHGWHYNIHTTHGDSLVAYFTQDELSSMYAQVSELDKELEELNKQYETLTESKRIIECLEEH